MCAQVDLNEHVLFAGLQPGTYFSERIKIVNTIVKVTVYTVCSLIIHNLHIRFYHQLFVKLHYNQINADEEMLEVLSEVQQCYTIFGVSFF